MPSHNLRSESKQSLKLFANLAAHDLRDQIVYRGANLVSSGLELSLCATRKQVDLANRRKVPRHCRCATGLRTPSPRRAGVG